MSADSLLPPAPHPVAHLVIVLCWILLSYTLCVHLSPRLHYLHWPRMTGEETMKHLRLNVYGINKVLTFILLLITLSTVFYVFKICYTFEPIKSTFQNGDPACVQNLNREQMTNRTFWSDSRFNIIRDYHKKTLQYSTQFNCRKLFEDDSKEQEKIILYKKLYQNKFHTFAESRVIPMLSNCQAFKDIRGYMQDKGEPEEQEFPLAYTILVHRDFEHLERLLRALYRPNHSFCIHLDVKAPGPLKSAVSTLVGCFKNVILASEPQTIIYAHISRLKADLVCMKDLLQLNSSWKYVINYAATEFPLRSNLETVKILKTLRGRNDIHESYKARIKDRFKAEYVVINGKMTATKVTLDPPPYNLTITKGQAYNAFTRSFVEWVLSEKIPRDFLNWSEKTYSPDEHYWGTLNNLYHNQFLKSPGGFKGEPDNKGYITKFISWQYSNSRYKCHGKIIHSICVFSALDLPTLMVQVHLAANKFDLNIDPIAYACVEELYTNRTVANIPLHVTFYKNLHFVQFPSD